MNYTLNQLQIFLKISQTVSITKAAEELHLTQPAVSIQLKNFQDQFDIPLTEHIGRKIYITEFGKKIAEAAENIINEVNTINYQTAAFKGLLTGKLKISVVSTGKYVMPFFLTEFINKNPNVEIQMDVTNKSKVVESLELNEVDFALVSILPTKLDLEKIDLLENNLYLVGSGTDYASIPSDTKEMFEKLPLIFRESGSGTRLTMEQFIEKQNLNIRKMMELTSNEAVKQAVLAGLGFSIMPIIGISDEINSGKLKIIPVDGLPLKTMWQITWQKNKKPSPVFQAYLKFLTENKASIITKYFTE
jgi:DNA-binding transcriptional LysR family regulator